MKRRLNININDYHDVLLDWQDVKKTCIDIDKEFEKFYGPNKVKAAGVRARKKIQSVRIKLHKIRENIMKQRQDYDSEY